MQTSEVAPANVILNNADEPVQEPSIDESTDKVEDTTINNESETSELDLESSDKEFDDSEDEVNEKTNASKTIDRLGKEKKLLLDKLVSVAKQSPEAKKALQELIVNSPNIAKKMKQSFGTDYDSMFKENQKFDTEDYESLKIKARAEVLLEQAQELTKQQLEKFAEDRNFNEVEFNTFVKYYEAISDVEEVDELEIMKRAALLTSPEKMSLQKRTLPSSKTKVLKTEKVKEINFSTKTQKSLQKQGIDPSEKAENVSAILSRIKNDGDRISLKL